MSPELNFFRDSIMLLWPSLDSCPCHGRLSKIVPASPSPTLSLLYAFSRRLHAVPDICLRCLQNTLLLSPMRTVPLPGRHAPLPSLLPDSYRDPSKLISKVASFSKRFLTHALACQENIARHLSPLPLNITITAIITQGADKWWHYQSLLLAWELSEKRDSFMLHSQR